MSECKYRNEDKHIVGWYGHDRPIYKTDARCLGQKNMPSCNYEDVEKSWISISLKISGKSLMLI